MTPVRSDLARDADGSAKHAVVGLLAHVDAGKTTLAEALLCHAGTIRTQGRVDHGDAYLDFEAIERERGITVFSKQAVASRGGLSLTLLDAPGHVDFCAEAERTLQVLDLAILVIGANDGVGGHTRTLWRLLDRYSVPTIVFVNKVDLVGHERAGVLRSLRERLDQGCLEASSLGEEAGREAAALTDEDALEEYLETGTLGEDTLRSLFVNRKLFPCVVGSALRMEGIEELWEVVGSFAPRRAWPDEFAARVYKVTHDTRGVRLAWLKVTGGTLRAKAVVAGTTAGDSWEEKVDQVRVYNGARHEVVQEVPAGRVCAVTGLSHVMPGDGLGFEGQGRSPALVPVLDYRVEPRGCDVHAVAHALQELAEEDPLLGAAWSSELKEMRVQLMGAIQQEVLRDTLYDRYGLDVSFGPGSVLYKESILSSVTGIGHFEPLRHYAEVHVRLDPLPRGSGVEATSECSEDELARNWQRLILTHVMEREHRGVLVGAPLTDVRIVLVAGRAHAKHTEGGDFRQATYRAIRQGLMQARSVLLEPWYRFSLELPSNKVGRALSDLQRMSARFGAPDAQGEVSVIEGAAPVAEMRGYALDVAAYTGGHGSLSLEFGGYEPCHDADVIVEASGYDPERDLDNTPDSVFCSHGAGYTVKWRDVASHAHVAS